MASASIISWQVEGEKVEAVTDFLFLGSKITVDGDWSHVIRRELLLGGKSMTNLDSVLKSKAITLPTKDPYTQGYGLFINHIRIWELDNKEGRALRIDAFELWCWRGLLRVLWATKRSNQSNLKGSKLWIFIGTTDAEAEAPILWPPDGKS